MKLFKVLGFAFLCTLYFVLCTSVKAEECTNIDDPEFHSLRPYPEKPCQIETSQYAEFCGNTLTLQETIPETYKPGDPNCKPVGNKITCSYIETIKPHTVTINLSGANLPIMGNTEEVTNYTGEADQLNDAEKTNEYVSWYLNGVTNRAEYPPATDSDQAVNFSGPLNKLLPLEIQEIARSETVKSAGEIRHDQVVGCVNLLGQITACYPQRLGVKEIRLSAWKDNLPPKREDFDSFQKWWLDYQRWRGDACVSILEASLCVDVPWNPNWPGNLFSYIPYSSTEDLKGKIKVDSVSSASGDNVENVKFTNQSPSTLFFPHIEEADQLGSLLQDTYLAKNEEKLGAPTQVASEASCDTVDVRSNKGDSLFASSITGSLSYTASFTCDFDPPSCSGSPATTGGNICRFRLLGKCVPVSWQCSRDSGTVDCSTGYKCGQGCSCIPKTQTCTKTIGIALSTSSNTPKIDDVWSRLVAGPTAIVKRMFPKLGTQIGALKDIPGSTNITYSGLGVQSSGELNLPHIGGISEYFLKGIQTLLRPKGYGEPISFAGAGNLPSKEIDCDESAPEVSLPNTLDKTSTRQLALNWISGQEGNHVLECYNDVVKKSQEKGVNPAFALIIWLNESNASNYNLSEEDFGVHDSSVKGFSAQITRFLGFPAAYKAGYPQCFGKGNDMEAFLRLFQSGNCTDAAGLKYAQHIKEVWGWVTNCGFIGYPTDTSCY